MKRIISLILCFMMVFGMMPAVIAAPVLDTVESAESYVEENVVEKAEQDVILAEDATAVYAEKPAAYDATNGKLIYFNNFNSEDAVGADIITMIGSSGTTTVAGGYYVQQLVQNYNYMPSPGFMAKLNSGNYSDSYNGTITVVADLYADSALKFYTCNNGGIGDAWGVTHTQWGGKTLTAGEFTKLTYSLNTSSGNFSALGRARSADSGTIYARSYAVYYQPSNGIILLEGENASVVELGEATTWTAVVPEGYSLLRDASGNYYKNGDSVAAGAVLTAVKLASKPAQYDANKGILVYFDNGYNADKYSNINATLVGYSQTSVVDGYVARDIQNPDAAGISGTWGIGLDTGSTETHFAYADGTDFVGDVWFYADMHNSHTSNLDFYWAARTKWQSWCGVGTNWQKVFAVANQWTKLEVGIDATLSFIGLARTAWGNYTYLNFRSAYAYYNPANRVYLYEGDTLIEIKDLGTATEWTVEAPVNTAYNAWIDSNGTYYFAEDKVPAGTTLTATSLYYAEKPATTTEDGELVFFYNGNAADTINELGAKLVGHYGTGVYDGYNVTYTVDCTELLGSCTSHGIAIAPEAEAYTKNGKITLVVEQFYNDAKTGVSYAAFSNTNLGVYKVSWSSVYADYDNQTAVEAGNWYTLKATADTANKMVGFFERSWINHSKLTRGFKSVAVYYIPTNYVKLTEGDSIKFVDLGEATEWTVVAPTDTEYNAWIDGEGTYYYAGDKVPAGTTLTAAVKTFYYAEKPVAVDATLGNLIYFDNFNAEEAVGADLITMIGASGTTVTVGDYYVQQINRDEAYVPSPAYLAKLNSGNYNDSYNGTITVVADLYSNAAYNFFTCNNGGIGTAWGVTHTQWLGQTLTAGEFTKLTYSLNTSSGNFSAFGRARSENTGTIYARSFAVYYKPANSVTLVDGESVSVVDLGEETTWTVTAPTAQGCNAWFGSDERYYTAGNTAPAGVTLTASTYATESDKYGTLVWSNEFNKTTGAATENWQSYTYNNPAWDITPSTGNLNFDSFVTLDGRKTVKVNSYWYGGYTLTNSSTDVHGYYTMVVDYYVKSEETEATSEGSFMTLNGSHVYPQAKGFDQWNSMAYTFLATETVPFQSIMFRGNTEGVNIYPYIDSIKLYWHDSNAVSLVEGGETYLVDLVEATELTLPAPKNEAYNVWQDASKNIYVPGTKVAAGTSYSAATVNFAEKPAQYDASAGILVFFENGNPADNYSNINATLVGYSQTSVVDGYVTRDLNDPATAGISGTVGIGLDTGDLDTKFAYADGTDFTGNVNFYVDMYNSADTDNSFRQGVRTWAWDEWCGVQTNWAGVGAAKAKEWTLIANAFNSNLSFIGFLDTDYKNWTGSTFRSAYAYHMPVNKVTLYDGDGKTLLEIKDLGTETTWTVAAPTNTAYNAWAGSDGKIYEAGETVAAGSVLTAISKAAYTLQLSSMRIAKNENDYSGLRFAGFVTNTMRALADEYGFVVARQDVVTDVNAIQVGAENTVYGVSYKKGVRDIVYVNASESTDLAKEKFGSYACEENGYYFTGVLTGVPMNTTALQTKLIGRTYIKIGGEYFYGETVVKSVYEVAEALYNYHVTAGNDVPEYIQTVYDIVNPAE